MNEQIVLWTLQSLIWPPGLSLAGILCTLAAFALRRRRAGFALGIATLALTWFTCSWFGAAWLAAPLEGRFVALDPAAPDPHGAEAIVVLAGGRSTGAPEYGGDTVKSTTLVRLRYGVRLHRKTGLPLLFSGGVVGDEALAEAALMAAAAREEFGVAPRFVETESRNTAGNARHSAELLTAAGIRRVLLVTHANHMLRATRAFEHYGLEVVPAPTRYVNRDTGPLELGDFLPDGRALVFARMALHERLGVLWYRWRYGIGPSRLEAPGTG